MVAMDHKEVKTAHHTPPAPPSCPGGQLYTVVPGDSLFLIAQRFGIPLSRLIRANPQITNPDLIFPGQVICVPVADTFCPTGFFYTIMRGDTLYEISRRLGITLEELLSYNPQIVNPDVIEVGQRICVPLPVPPADCEGEYYLVRAGETLSGIARHFGISVQDILRINPQITNADLIYAGQVICIPRRMIRPRPPAPPPPPHGPMPCPSGPGMPYPSLEGPFFVLPAVRWEDCPYAPRDRCRRPRQRRCR
ncbi:MAG TPA: LysM peptidoglycan-binding domain-containing protein [Firmicutes bacterium]|jgi:spore coat assembly protein SafA|nr:LysM peptidoglycan-binding domain-containing protein [Bacillota bacterium]